MRRDTVEYSEKDCNIHLIVGTSKDIDGVEESCDVPATIWFWERYGFKESFVNKLSKVLIGHTINQEVEYKPQDLGLSFHLSRAVQKWSDEKYWESLIWLFIATIDDKSKPIHALGNDKETRTVYKQLWKSEIDKLPKKGKHALILAAFTHMDKKLPDEVGHHQENLELRRRTTAIIRNIYKVWVSEIIENDSACLQAMHELVGKLYEQDMSEYSTLYGRSTSERDKQKIAQNNARFQEISREMEEFRGYYRQGWTTALHSEIQPRTKRAFLAAAINKQLSSVNKHKELVSSTAYADITNLCKIWGEDAFEVDMHKKLRPHHPRTINAYLRKDQQENKEWKRFCQVIEPDSAQPSSSSSSSKAKTATPSPKRAGTAPLPGKSGTGGSKPWKLERSKTGGLSGFFKKSK